MKSLHIVELMNAAQAVLDHRSSIGDDDSKLFVRLEAAVCKVRGQRPGGSALGNRVIQLRCAKGMNSAQLAKAAGINRGMLHRIENHPAPNPTLSTALAIARALDVSTVELLSQ